MLWRKWKRMCDLCRGCGKDITKVPRPDSDLCHCTQRLARWERQWCTVLLATQANLQCSKLRFKVCVWFHCQKNVFHAITVFCMCHTSEHMFHGSFIKSYEILVNIQGVFHIFNGKRLILISALINYATIMCSCVIFNRTGTGKSSMPLENEWHKKTTAFPFTF